VSDRLLKLLLVDDDPIFGLGFRTALAVPEFSDISIINQVFNFADALQTLAATEVNILVLEIDLDNRPNESIQFGQQIHTQYPQVSVFLLTANSEAEYLLAAQEAGFKGYCAKKSSLATIAQGLRQVGRGEFYWQGLSQKTTQKLVKKTWLSQQTQKGLYDIDQNLDLINNSLNNKELPLIDWLFWTGRKRELLLARWLVKQLAPGEVIILNNPVSNSYKPIDTYLDLTIVNNESMQITTLAKITIFDETLAKIQGGLENLTGNLLEIDILALSERQELLYVVVNQLRLIIRENEFLKLDADQVGVKIEGILRQLWLDSTLIFLRKKYPLTVENQESELLEVIWGEFVSINREIFSQIPEMKNLLEYLIIKQELMIERISYGYESPEAKNRAEMLLHNLVIEVANAVMQVILNNFSEQEYIRKIYQMKSSREIAKFRNRVSSRYRRQKYWEEPNNIFEDRFLVYYLDGSGIRKNYIEGDRQKELKQLKGLRWVVTMAIETRDALAPGLKALEDWTGRGIVYVLTEIIGKGLGLIGKGIIQGVGNTLEELRYKQKKR